jgi:hypothetical protein
MTKLENIMTNLKETAERGTNFNKWVADLEVEIFKLKALAPVHCGDCIYHIEIGEESGLCDLLDFFIKSNSKSVFIDKSFYCALGEKKPHIDKENENHC